MPLTTQIASNYPNQVFVETGAYEGVGISAAIDAGYKRIISIEIAEIYLNLCKEKFKDKPCVELVLGDSADILGDVISTINEPITFWLDGHYSGGNKPKGKYLSPLLQELEYIKAHKIKEHTILIDDVWCWKEKDNIYHNGFDIDTLVNNIKEINSKYKIEFIDGACFKSDILLARL
jgi:hypothetical protein